MTPSENTSHKKMRVLSGVGDHYFESTNIQQIRFRKLAQGDIKRDVIIICKKTKSKLRFVGNINKNTEYWCSHCTETFWTDDLL